MTDKPVLIIEDDRFIGEMYVRSLKHAGYQVDWMVDGRDGLVAARNKEYGIILLDIMLPEMRGTEILNALRGETDLVPNTKIIILTNFDQDRKVKADMEAKSDGYLIKADLTPKSLLQFINELDNKA